MWPLTHKKGSGRYGAIITIGSARITASWVALPPGGGKPVFHRTVAVRYPHYDSLDTPRFIKRMFGALMQAVLRLSELRSAGEIPSRFFRPDFLTCTLTAPWFIGQRRTIHMAREKDFRITSPLLRNLVEHELDAAREEIENTLSHGALWEEGSPYVTESAILQVRGNGYPTKAPLNKMVRELSLVLYVSYLSRPIAEKIRQVLLDSFPEAEEVQFISSTYAVYEGITHYLNPPHQYLMLEINGEITDVTIVRDLLPVDTVSFPFGSSTLVRTVAHNMGAPVEDMHTRMRLMANAHADRTGTTAHTLEQEVYQVANAWIDQLFDTLKKQSGGRPISPFAYLATDVAWESLFHTALKERAFELFPFSDKALTVHSLAGPEIKKRCVVKSGAQFIPLAALSALMHTVQPPIPIDVPQGMLYSVTTHHG